MPKVVSPRNTDNTFNVQSYGATGLGSADESAAFQAAANAAMTFAASYGNATVKIPPGSYKLNSTVVVSGGKVTVDAYGAYIFAGTSNDLFRNYTGTQDTTFTKFGNGLIVQGGIWDCQGHLRAQGVASGNAGYSAFTIACATNTTFRDLTIRNVKSYHGIDINTCDGVVVDNCRFEGFKNSHEWKTQVKCASTAPLTLSTGFAAGQVIDGYTLVLADRILIKNQAAGQDNGIYTVTAGTPTRVTDMDTAAECNDAAVNVLNGTTQAGMNYVQTATIVTIGTTVQTWATTWHLQVKAATTGNITLSAPQTIDGVSLIAGDRCLVQAQTLSKDNGIYAVAAGAWTRVTDMNSGATVTAPCSVHVASGGTTYGGKDRTQTATVTTIGTDAQSWSNEYIVDRYFSEACQIDEGDFNTPSKNVKVVNCYMGPATDSSGLLSFGKMAGSHTDSPAIVYQNIQIIGNTSVASLSNSFQGDSWADAIISNNIVLGSAERGIRCLFTSSNTGPRITITGNTISNTISHGIEIDGSSGTFADVNVSGNTITNTAMVGATCGIRIDTCSRLTVSGNEIQNGGTGNQNIMITGVTGGTVSGNGCYNAGTIGIQIAGSSNILCSGNSIITPNGAGIYASALATKVTISGNFISGATATTNVIDGAIGISGTSNTDILVMGNRLQKGAGLAAQPFRVEGTNSPAVEFNNNSLGSDYTANTYANYSIAGTNTTCKLVGSDGTHITRIGSDVTGLITTSFTNVTGLSCAIPLPGKYRFKAFIAYTMPNNATGTATFAATTPTPNVTVYSTTIESTTSAAAVVTASGVTENSTQGAAAAVTVQLAALVDGFMDVSASGTLQIQYKAGGTAPSITVKTGTMLIVERIA